MPYSIATNDVIEYTLRGQLDGQTMLTVLHFRALVTGPITDGRAKLLAFITKELTFGAATITNEYVNCLSQQWVMDNIYAQVIKPTRYVRVVGIPSEARNGAVEVDSLPSSVAAAITKRSNGTAGRHGQGTVHMGAVPTTFASGSVLTPAAVSAYSLLGQVLAEDYVIDTALTLQPVIFDRSSPSTSAIYRSCDPELTIRTMKRRVVGRGI